MTKNVEDSALILTAIAGRDARDSASSDVPVADYTRALGKSVKGLRLGIPREYFFEDIDDEIRHHVIKAIDILHGLGIATEEISLPYVKHSPTLLWIIVGAEASSYHETFFRTRAEEYGRDIRANLEVGQFVLASHYLKAQQVRNILRDQVLEILKKVDVIVSPTTLLHAPKIGQRIIKVGDQEISVVGGLARFTCPFNLSGVPAISLPCGFTSSGLPIGLQIAGRPFDEETILKVAWAYEANTSWHQRRPPV
jgi:aspartyl-tRNA(Asn)/glutamyl-tRNA(Gln) amidotransferase subunit A